jgi:hypothetical protein
MLRSGGLKFHAYSSERKEKLCETPISAGEELGVVHACRPSYNGKHKIGGLQAGQNVCEVTRTEKVGGVAHIVECLPVSTRS